MTIEELIQSEVFQLVNKGNDLDRTIEVPFCCDLLSIAMSKAPKNSAWITVMGNINTLAVAVLTEVACIILAEGTKLDDAAIKKSKEQNITVFYTNLPIFETALTVYRYIHG